MLIALVSRNKLVVVWQGVLAATAVLAAAASKATAAATATTAAHQEHVARHDDEQQEATRTCSECRGEYALSLWHEGDTLVLTK